MPLPDVIEIVPLDKTVRAEITVPGSKSITNRALILAALAEGEVMLRGALWSEDTQIMVECLHTLGFDVKVAVDPAEFARQQNIRVRVFPVRSTYQPEFNRAFELINKTNQFNTCGQRWTVVELREMFAQGALAQFPRLS